MHKPIRLAQPVALPARLADLLVDRAARCGADARAVLGALAVAGRPLTDGMLGEVTGTPTACAPPCGS